MFKYFSVFLLILALNRESGGVPTLKDEDSIILSKALYSSDSELSSEWEAHIMDFLKVIDVNKVIGVAIGYMNDDEVLNLLAFLLSPQFKEIVWEFESIEEFKEAFSYLASNGYETDFLIDYINSALDLPPFEKPKMLVKSGKGVSGLIEDIIATLPVDDMKKLFEIKLQTVPEIARLFDVINSEEFINILRKMSQNPKFKEIEVVFEGYGFDFKYLCSLAKEIFGDYYQGIFCE